MRWINEILIKYKILNEENLIYDIFNLMSKIKKFPTKSYIYTRGHATLENVLNLWLINWNKLYYP